jgi:hypothetical protein
VREAIGEELTSFLSVAEQRLARDGVGRLDWLEVGLRDMFLSAGSRIIEALLCDRQLAIEKDERLRGERRLKDQCRTIDTLFGAVAITRHGYYDAQASSSRYPWDDALQLLDGFTPATAKLICRFASREPYQVASSELAATTGLGIDARRIQRLVQKVGPAFRQLQDTLPQQKDTVPRMYVLADGTGVPMRPDVLSGGKGKQPDGSAKTQEVKVGCVFTEHPETGKDPVRDQHSTTYVATMKPSDQFGPMLRTEARRRNIGAAKEMIFISDAAHYFKEIARTCFPQATWILDFYHASEHLYELVHTLYTPETKKAQNLAKLWTRWLLSDKVDRIITRATELAAPDNLEGVNQQLQYFQKHPDGMMYATFASKGYFIGSGVVEAGCKTLVGKRLKQSGMFWSEQGAENVLAFRSAIFSDNYDDIWQLNIRRQARQAA